MPDKVATLESVVASKDVVHRVLNCIPSRDTETDWTWEAAIAAAAVPHMASAAIPESVGLRHANWKVRDQGSSGACVGFATADGVLRYHYAKKRWIKSLDEQPSPRFVWMADKETDEITDYPTTFIEGEGTQLKHALDIVRQYGCVMEADLPMSGALWQGTRQEFYTRASRFRIISYNNLGTNQIIWKKWLASNGPILTRLNVDATWDAVRFNVDATRNAVATDGNLDVYQPATVRGGHAVCLVGYTADGRFIVRNSWGNEWGHNGFAYASRDYAAAAFTEAYGVVI